MMENGKQLFKRNTIFFLNDKEEYSYEEILEFIGESLTALGYAKESFAKALKDRERVFPTGLQMQPYGIAIPHADQGHVYKPCVGVVRLKGGAVFRDMVEPDREVRAKIIFCIAIAGEEKQTDVLQDIMRIASDESLMSCIVDADSEEEIYELLTEGGKAAKRADT